MLPIIQIGPAAIQSSSLALLIALWLGTMLAERACQSRGIDTNHVWNVVGVGVPATIVSARLVFVLQNWNAYANNLAQIFSLTPSALSIDYGVLLGLVVAYAYIRWRKIPFARFADALAPGALAAIVLIAVGQFLSGDAYGTPTDLPWAVSFWGEFLHPVQLYDALAAIVGLIIVGRVRAARDGISAWFAIAWYSGARVLIDAFRGDATILENGYRVSQVVALFVALIALWFLSQKGETHATEFEIQIDGERTGS